jgi:hypothetical protein
VMKHLPRMSAFRIALLLVIFVPTHLVSQTRALAPVVVSVRISKQGFVYRVNGKTVEDTKENSLLANLTQIVKTRGTGIPVFIVVDVQAPFAEVGKLETALDKVELTQSRRLFVTDFRSSVMNEIHWDQTPIPIP